jgi:hypothetical protein
MADRIHTQRDLQRYVSDVSVGIQADYYDLDFDDLINAVANDILDTLCEDYNFFWGDEFPSSMSDEQFWDFFKPYEKNNE